MMQQILNKKIVAAFLCLFSFLAMQAAAETIRETALNQKYRLKEMVVLSRHNIRAPLSGGNSILGRVTTRHWIKWSANPSELTLRGGILETIMGQYFRKYAEAEKLFKENAEPNTDEVNIYANSMQRTIATAQYFKSGMFPVATNVTVYHRYCPGKMDPVFFPRLTKISPRFVTEAKNEINQMGGKEGLKGWTESLKPSFRLIEKVLNMESAPACAQDNICSLNDYDTKLIFKLNQEPNLSGSLKLATKISDALILQYYEEPDAKKAAFGENLSYDDWTAISRVKDVYGDILFSAPIVAVNVAHPLLQYLFDELNSPVRKFTYMVGHDSNISSVTSALETQPYELPNTIERRTPIGCKLVFEKWEDKTTHQQYVSIKLIYQTTRQLRELLPLDLQHQPEIYPIHLKGLQENAEGLYKLGDVNNRFLKAIQAYGDIK